MSKKDRKGACQNCSLELPIFPHFCSLPSLEYRAFPQYKLHVWNSRLGGGLSALQVSLLQSLDCIF